MRAGLSTIQQTLTPEAASVLNHSIAEAGRRNHGQTTPLHVAATLLSSPNGFLRQACIKSHPNSSHPLQCRALELCFSVALERLPTAQNMSPGAEPPISNALMAALKRAQAHQRRGCPEQQQQPLLAVKVELEQLIISILDDPSVSRVMREASFSSPAVKATIEQSLNSSAPANSSPIGLGFRPTTVNPTRNLYLNPRLQQGNAAQPAQQRGEEVKKVIDILLRTKKRNPVLVGESEPEAVVKELLRRIENKELGEGLLSNIQIIHLEKEISADRLQIPSKLQELGDLVESRMMNLNGGGVILDLGDLKWLVQQPAMSTGVSGSGAMQQQVVSEGGRAAVAEMCKLLAKYGDGGGGGGGRLWLIGTATCETYLRCQVYHPSMENDWDLQAVPIAARAPLTGLFPRLGSTGILSSPVESLSPIKGFPTAATIPMRRVMPESLDSGRRPSYCSQCTDNYERELEKLVVNEFEKPSSAAKTEGAKLPLPQWLQNAKAQDEDAKKNETNENLDKELIRKQKIQELQKKWHDMCLRLHPNFHSLNKFSSERTMPISLPITTIYAPNLLGHQPFQPKLQLNKGPGETLQLKTNPPPKKLSEQLVATQLGSPVGTELVLGRLKDGEISAEQTHEERVKDFLGCISSEPENKSCELRSDKLVSSSEIELYKRLFKGLLEKVWWQQEAASALATTVTQFRLGNGKRQGTASKGDMWLLFMGPDRVGKKKMAAALAELVSGSDPVNICLGSKRRDGESDVSIRGRTVLDRISEAVRRNRFSVIVLEDIDDSDLLVRGSIKRAMERGRFTDSHGREISLGNIIFILTTTWIPDDVKHLFNGNSLLEEKFASLAKSTCQLKLSLGKKTVKRQADWAHGEDRSLKPRVDTASAIAFDLNETADAEDERTDGSLNSSDVTTDNETDHGLNNRQLSLTTSSASLEMFNTVDETIIFKPVDFTPIKHSITNSINRKFSSIVGEKISLELQDNALEKITSGVWLGKTNVEEWTEKILVPSLKEFKACLPNAAAAAAATETMVVRLESDDDSGCRSSEDQPPCSITVAVGGKLP